MIFNTVFQFRILFSLAFGLLLAGNSHGQCSAEPVPLSQTGFSYALEATQEQAVLEFSLESLPGNTMGSIGYELFIYLDENLSTNVSLQFESAGAWLFQNASMSIVLDYSAAENYIRLKAVRTDCAGATSSGFAGKIVLEGEGLGSLAVVEITGGIVMVDNIDAG